MELSAFSQSCFQIAQGLFDLRIQLILALGQGTHAATSSSAPSASTIPIPAAKSFYQLTRHLRLYGKMFRRMQQLSIQRFVALPHANDFVLYYWGEVVKATSGTPELISGKQVEWHDCRLYLTKILCEVDSPVAIYPIRLLLQGMVLFRESLIAWSGKGKSGNPAGVFYHYSHLRLIAHCSFYLACRGTVGTSRGGSCQNPLDAVHTPRSDRSGKVDHGP